MATGYKRIEIKTYKKISRAYGSAIKDENFKDFEHGKILIIKMIYRNTYTYPSDVRYPGSNGFLSCIFRRIKNDRIL
jgi:hypothetical protein